MSATSDREPATELDPQFRFPAATATFCRNGEGGEGLLFETGAALGQTRWRIGREGG